jgi:hypothetical protein
MDPLRDVPDIQHHQRVVDDLPPGRRRLEKGIQRLRPHLSLGIRRYYIAYKHGVFKLDLTTGSLGSSCLPTDPLDHVGRFKLGYDAADPQKRGRGDFVEYQETGGPAPSEALGWCGLN